MTEEEQKAHDYFDRWSTPELKRYHYNAADTIDACIRVGDQESAKETRLFARICWDIITVREGWRKEQSA